MSELKSLIGNEYVKNLYVGIMSFIPGIGECLSYVETKHIIEPITIAFPRVPFLSGLYAAITTRDYSPLALGIGALFYSASMTLSDSFIRDYLNRKKSQ